jgi:hypothetical protein
MPTPRSVGSTVKAAGQKVLGALKPPPLIPPLGKPPGGPSAAAMAAARTKVAALLANVKQSRAGNSKEVELVEKYLIGLIARGGSYEDFVADMRGRARAAAEQNRHLIQKAATLARMLQDPSRRQRYRDQVLRPAQSRSISGPEAWRRTDDIMGCSVRTDSSSAPPPSWTIYPTLSVETSFLLGVQQSVGLCGMRHGMACYAQTWTVAIGAQAGVGFTAAVSFNPCTPPELAGVALSIGIGAAYGPGFDIGIGLVPTAFTEQADEVKLTTWFDGLSVGVTGGAEIELSVGFEVTEVYRLIG